MSVSFRSVQRVRVLETRIDEAELRVIMVELKDRADFLPHNWVAEPGIATITRPAYSRLSEFS